MAGMMRKNRITVVMTKSIRQIAGHRGAAAIEYSLIVSFIALVVFLAIGQVGVAVANLYSEILNAFF